MYENIPVTQHGATTCCPQRHTKQPHVHNTFWPQVHAGQLAVQPLVQDHVHGSTNTILASS
jgi:hypothetical protein